MRLEVEGHVLGFEGLGSGNAMLFREDPDSGATLVALDAYHRERVAALVSLAEHDTKAVITLVEWQEDGDAGIFEYAAIAITIVLAIAALYELYVEFFQ